MSTNYTLKDFFRQMPNAMLARYFEAKGIAHGLDVGKLPATKPDPWMELWGKVPEDKRPDMDADFQEIYAMCAQKGTAAIFDELAWHQSKGNEEAGAIIEKLANLKGHHERAMVLFLDHFGYWKAAARLHHADTFTLASWRKRGSFPKKDAAVDDASIAQFSNLIRNYFHYKEGRGKHCFVEAYRRGERDYFFAYPEDYSQRSTEWVGADFGTRPHNPALEVVFVYSKAEGSLDINFKGSKKAIEPLQSIFAQAILKLNELPADPKDERRYNLAPLAQKSFEFTFSAASGIQRVVVKKIRLASIAKQGDKITLEANTAQDKNAVYTLLESVEKSLPMRLYHVTQVELAATVSVSPDKPAKTVTIRITHPNSCSLKYDGLDLRLRDMLEASNIEPKTPDAETDDDPEAEAFAPSA